MKKTLTILMALFPLMTFPVELSALAGSEVDTRSQSYSYFGLLGESRFDEKNSIMGKVWADYLTYKFEESGREVKAKAPALQVSLGYKRYVDIWSLAFWAGWERRDTNVEPDTMGAEVKGLDNSLLLQFELDGWFEKGVNLSFITSYSSSTSYLWARGRVKKGFLSKNTRLGLELIGQRNKDYRAVQTGLLGEYHRGRLSFGLHGGYKNSSSGNGLYIGAELYRGF